MCFKSRHGFYFKMSVSSRKTVFSGRLLRTTFQYPVHFTNTSHGSRRNRYKHLTWKLALFVTCWSQGKKAKTIQRFSEHLSQLLKSKQVSGRCRFDRRKKLLGLICIRKCGGIYVMWYVSGEISEQHSSITSRKIFFFYVYSFDNV